MAFEDCESQSDLPRLPAEPCTEYAIRLARWNAARSTGGYSYVPPVGLPEPYPGAASPRMLSLSTADPKGWTGLPLPIAIPVVPSAEPPMSAALRLKTAMPFPAIDTFGIGPLPVGVPSTWSPAEASVPPPFFGPAGSVAAGLREPFGDSSPVRSRDQAFAAIGYDRSWGVPPPMTGMYAGLVWSPERLLFEPGASLPREHWYRALVREGVYVQAYQDDESSPGVWKYRYVRVGSLGPDLSAPYIVLGALSDLYREQEIRERETTDKAATETSRTLWKYDNSLVARISRGETVKEAEFQLPEKFKRMEIKKEPVLLPMPFWTAVSKASVKKMYEDAGLPPPEFPGEVAAANNQAFQDFKEVRGHDQKSSAFFIPAEEQWDAQEAARRQRIKDEKEAAEQARADELDANFTDVPSVVGMTEDDAMSVLKEAKLSFDVVGDTTGKARVYSQRPGAGDRVAKGTVVGIRFLAEGDRRAPTTVDRAPSSGSATAPKPTHATMPTLTRMPYSIASKEILERLGAYRIPFSVSFAGDVVPKADSSVVTQSPAAGTILSSDKFVRIVLKLSEPAKPDAVPSGKPSAMPDGPKSGPGKYFVRHADGKTTYSSTPESAWGPPEEAGGHFVSDGSGNWIWHAW